MVFDAEIIFHNDLSVCPSVTLLYKFVNNTFACVSSSVHRSVNHMSDEELKNELACFCNIVYKHGSTSPW